MRFKPGELCYWKVKAYDPWDSVYFWDYILVQFVGKKKPPKGALNSDDPADWSYRVWLVETASSRVEERLVKDSELFGKEAVDSELWECLS
jgi:hypothetical protein